MSNTSERLKLLMHERNLRQVDILKLVAPFCDLNGVKLTKSDLSQFVNGKVLPGQWKLTLLGKALNVSEAWLMGFDVPRDRDPRELLPVNAHLCHEESRLVTIYRSLNAAGKRSLMKQAELHANDEEFTT